jgi:predicted nucleotidyltransferase component of viral defense system
MNLFDKLVTEVLEIQPDLAPLRPVVEKELLHHDILRILNQHELLTGLTFIGGTCLRTCYGSARLSEDLDFTGGLNFTRSTMAALGTAIVDDLMLKYGLPVLVTEPVKDIHNVDTWKIKVETRMHKKDLPVQRINIDICAVSSYEPCSMMLLNPYGVERGTSGLIIQAQSREEIYADKLLAIALRLNRVKYRDIWDIMWLQGQQVRPHLALVPQKLQERSVPLSVFMHKLKQRVQAVVTHSASLMEFRDEMRRFLPAAHLAPLLESDALWKFCIYVLEENLKQVEALWQEPLAKVF